MIIYNEDKELILKDDFREFHLKYSGFAFIQKNTIADLKKIFASFEENENDTKNLKAAFHDLKEIVKKTGFIYSKIARDCVAKKLDSLLPEDKDFINKKTFLDIVKSKYRSFYNLTNGTFDTITTGAIALVYASDSRITFDGIEKRENSFKGLAEVFEKQGNKYFSVNTKTFKNIVKIYDKDPICLTEKLAINPEMFKNITRFFNFIKAKNVNCCISGDYTRVKFWNDTFILIFCPMEYKAEKATELSYYGFTALESNPCGDPRTLPSLLPLPGNPDYMQEISDPVIATETEEKEIAESENCIDEENHNPDNCAEFTESGIISTENGNIFPIYNIQLFSLALICCYALHLHSLRAYLAACLYMHLSACFQASKWKDKSFFDTS